MEKELMNRLSGSKDCLKTQFDWNNYKKDTMLVVMANFEASNEFVPEWLQKEYNTLDYTMGCNVNFDNNALEELRRLYLDVKKTIYEADSTNIESVSVRAENRLQCICEDIERMIFNGMHPDSVFIAKNLKAEVLQYWDDIKVKYTDTRIKNVIARCQKSFDEVKIDRDELKAKYGVHSEEHSRSAIEYKGRLEEIVSRLEKLGKTEADAIILEQSRTLWREIKFYITDMMQEALGIKLD